MAERQHASAGHKLGQLVGDWFEEFFVWPLLQQVADELRVYLDHRFRERQGRAGEKIIWPDVEGNEVDYDFVMELDGSNDKIALLIDFRPTAHHHRLSFLERQQFLRRNRRHLAVVANEHHDRPRWMASRFGFAEWAVLVIAYMLARIKRQIRERRG